MEMKKVRKEKSIIGRSEFIDFPEFGLNNIPAKIDTGAYSTALHSSKIWIEKNEDIEVLCFNLRDQDKKTRTIRCENFRQKNVKSSNGKKELRYIIKTTLIIAGKKRISDVSLTNRRNMKFKVLVGRKVLNNGFLIDVSKSNIQK